MNWTESIPKIDGWYWRIEAHCIDGECHYISEPIACQVSFDEDGELKIAKGSYFISGNHAKLKSAHRYLWFGPIQVPQPPDGWEKGEPADWKSADLNDRDFDPENNPVIAKIMTEVKERNRLLAEQYGEDFVVRYSGLKIKCMWASDAVIVQTLNEIAKLAASVQNIVGLKFPDQHIEPLTDSCISRSILYSVNSFVAAQVNETADGIREEQLWMPDLWNAWRASLDRSKGSA